MVHKKLIVLVYITEKKYEKLLHNSCSMKAPHAFFLAKNSSVFANDMFENLMSH